MNYALKAERELWGACDGPWDGAQHSAHRRTWAATVPFLAGTPPVHILQGLVLLCLLLWAARCASDSMMCRVCGVVWQPYLTALAAA